MFKIRHLLTIIIVSIFILFSMSLNAFADEKIKFKSIDNILDYVFILDDKPDPEVELDGYLHLPEGDGPFPVVVFVHGSSGIRDKHDQWISFFNAMDIAVFQIDCFGGRGIKSISNKPGTQVSSTAMMADAYGALKFLANHPKIDKTRIGVMGSSRGGTVAMVSAWKPVAEKLAGDLRFAFQVGLYPACADFKKFEFTGAPMLLLCGQEDINTPAQPCVELIKKMKGAGYPAEVVVFSGAYHSFDSYSDAKDVDKTLDLTNCRFCIEANGETFETNSGKSMADPKEKVKGFRKCAKVVTQKMGENRKAKEESKRLIKELVTEVFKLSSTQ